MYIHTVDGRGLVYAAKNFSFVVTNTLLTSDATMVPGRYSSSYATCIPRNFLNLSPWYTDLHTWDCTLVSVPLALLPKSNLLTS